MDHFEIYGPRKQRVTVQAETLPEEGPMAMARASHITAGRYGVSSVAGQRTVRNRYDESEQAGLRSRQAFHAMAPVTGSSDWRNVARLERPHRDRSAPSSETGRIGAASSDSSASTGAGPHLPPGTGSDWRSVARLERLGTMSGYACGSPDRHHGMAPAITVAAAPVSSMCCLRPLPSCRPHPRPESGRGCSAPPLHPVPTRRRPCEGSRRHPG